MTDYLLLMHRDAPQDAPPPVAAAWPEYFAKLRQSGAFEGGSSIGGGVCVSRRPEPRPITQQLSGYIRIRARDLDHAKELVRGNPVYEAGGTVEIRELPTD
jgi:hypothetical protein